tara:strand:- start:2612 stop:3172 length:561 start_codon:yes stop_codon:yes gene_type:complete
MGHLYTSIKNNNNDEEKGLIRQFNNKIYYSGPINDQTIFAITTGIITLQQEPSITNIDLHIQSGGGALLPTLNLVDIIKNSDIPINTYVDGYAASAASLISVVGAQRFINKHGVILIHQLKMGVEYGKFSDIKDQTENANTLMQIIKDIYLENTNLSLEKLEYLLDHDYWLNATTLKKYGLVDIIM